MYFKYKIKLFKVIILKTEKIITEQIQGLVQRNKPREQVRGTSQPLDATVFFSKCPFDLFFFNLPQLVRNVYLKKKFPWKAIQQIMEEELGVKK